MPGIYTRDQFAQQLANAIENAQARRQAFVDREAQRRNQNAQTIGNFAKALGRTAETWQSDEDKLAALQKEREEVIRAQQEHDQELRDERASSMIPSSVGGPSVSVVNANDMRDYVPMSRYSEVMRGYVPTEAMYSSRPVYSDIIKRGGLY